MKKLLATLIFSAACSSSFAQSIPGYVPKDSLLGWYPFNNNANNEFGTGKNGTVYGAIPAEDRFGNANAAYYFNDDSHSVIIDTGFFNVGWDNYTISLWSQSDSLDPVAHNQNMLNTGPHHGIGIDFNWNVSNKYSFFIASHTTGGWDVFNNAKSHDTVTINTWNHFVLVKEGGTAYRFYINGILDTSVTASVSAEDHYCRMSIGNLDPSSGASEPFRGKLDDYGFWNRTLEKCEIVRLFDPSIYTYLTSVPTNISAHVMATVNFSVTDTGTGNTYQWQQNAGSGFVNLTNTPPYSGVTTSTLTVTGITSVMNEYQFRCVVAGSQVCSDTSSYAKLAVTSLAVNNVNTLPAISISPNPTTGDLFILGADKVDVKVYNTLGQLVKTAIKTEKISVSELPAGLYTIKLYNERGEVLYNDKVVKK